jgi:quercetin dioxygenase-like cupin family protein
MIMKSATLHLEKDPRAIAPDIYAAPIDNDRVRVLDIHLKPGEKVPMHSHPATVFYAASDCKVRFTYPDGKSEIVELKDGQCIFNEALTHEPENIGDTACHVLNIELKR